jgi:MinD superfamily P-loop ATPase
MYTTKHLNIGAAIILQKYESPNSDDLDHLLEDANIVASLHIRFSSNFIKKLVITQTSNS